MPPDTRPPEPDDDPVTRAASLAALGQRSSLEAGDAARLSDAASRDPDARVRAAALAALVRRGSVTRATAAWADAVGDADARVRRRAAELSPQLARRASRSAPTLTLVGLLDDEEVAVVEAAAWALGELTAPSAVATAALSDVAAGHADPLAREAAVAALGARGDEAGLAAIAAACRDTPAVRRRAVLALAPFDGPAVDAALAAALEDRDWQVRQAAEDLLGSTSPSGDVPGG